MYDEISIQVHRASRHTVLRSWRERLLSWPWRPWVRQRAVETPANIAPNDCYRVGYVYHVGEDLYDQLIAGTRGLL